MEGGFRAPAMIRWPGKFTPARSRTASSPALDWFPTFLAAAGKPNIIEAPQKGQKLGDTTYKIHLDGYNQLDLLPGKGPIRPS